MKTHRWLVLGLIAALLAGAASACIEALTLPKMLSRIQVRGPVIPGVPRGDVVEGKVTGVRSVRINPTGMDFDDRIYTVVEVTGTSLLTGRPVRQEAAFLGGVFQGESMLVTSMPGNPRLYSPGNEVVIFAAPVNDWHPSITHAIYAATGGIYQVVGTPRHGKVVLGKGEGFAVDRNLPVSELRQSIARILHSKEVK